MLIRYGEIALAERENSEGSVFLVTPNNKTWCSTEKYPCMTYEKALLRVKDQAWGGGDITEEELTKLLDADWFEVEKYIPDKDGNLGCCITWVLNVKGEIIFFSDSITFDDTIFSPFEDIKKDKLETYEIL